MIGPAADLFSLLYGLAAIYTIVQLAKHWGELWDDRLTTADLNLASQAGFLLLTPVGVLVHELAHYFTAQAFGARALSISFRFYWGFVSYRGSLSPEAEFLIAAAGPAASAVIGLAALALAARLKDAWSMALRTFGSLTLVITLLIYPLASFSAFYGDFRTIYSPATPTLSLIAGAFHVAAAAAALYLLRRAPQPIAWAPAADASVPGAPLDEAHDAPTEAPRR